MMMGLGFLVMLAVLAVPILLLANLLMLMVRPILGRVKSAADLSLAPPAAVAAPGARMCSHCGTTLLPEWAHCPQCGASAGRTW